MCAGTPWEQDVCIFICARAPEEHDACIFICAGALWDQDVFTSLCAGRLGSRMCTFLCVLVRLVGCLYFYACRRAWRAGYMHLFVPVHLGAGCNIFDVLVLPGIRMCASFGVLTCLGIKTYNMISAWPGASGEQAVWIFLLHAVAETVE